MNDKDDGLVTRAGVRLTPEHEAHLVAEAEQGFDPAALVRRAVGRPSLSRAPGRASRLDVRVDDVTHADVQRQAREQNRAVSDVMRWGVIDEHRKDLDADGYSIGETTHGED